MPRAETEAALPLSDAEIAALLAPFAGARKIALAVSGGADSFGMLAAVARWRPAALSVIVLTVDHRLQAGSGKVAAGVAKAARKLGFEARILARRGPAPASDIEGAARSARYSLLAAACRREGATYLLTAHQRDDLAESFLMRLRRAAGVFGLAAMRATLPLDGLTLARPFLSVPRARLRATAIAAGLTPFEDPMNADARFERAQVRKLLPVLAELGLDAAVLASASERLGDAADTIERAASAFLASAVDVDVFAVARLDIARFKALPYAVRLRVLARLVMAVGGNDYPARRDRLIALHGALLGEADQRKRTLGGTVMQVGDGWARFYRETGREGLPSVRLAPGERGVWDHRFSYAVAPDAPRGLVLAPWPGPRRALPPGMSAAVRKAALAAVPAVLRRGKPIDPSPILERFPSDSQNYVALRCTLRERLVQPRLIPDFGTR